MKVGEYRVHEVLLLLSIRRQAEVSRRTSIALIGGGFQDMFRRGRLVRGRGDRVRLGGSGHGDDRLVDAIVRSRPPISRLLGRAPALPTWIRRATMIHGTESELLASHRLRERGVVERSGGTTVIGKAVRGVTYHERDPGLVDSLVAEIRRQIDGQHQDDDVMAVLACLPSMDLIDLVVGGSPRTRQRYRHLIANSPFDDLPRRALVFATAEFGLLS